MKKFFFDFEATDKNEIIAFGCVAENGATFYSLVKPSFSEITGYIKELTHIDEKQLANAPSYTEVLHDFDVWLSSFNIGYKSMEFYVYGNTDLIFLKTSMESLYTNRAILMNSLLITKIKDYSEYVKKYFNTNVSLIHAYNYILESQKKQEHHALDDAIMLKTIFDNINDKPALTFNPFKEKIKIELTEDKYPVNYVVPSGRISCRHRITKKEYQFNNIKEAVEWLIQRQVPSEARDRVHRAEMCKKIMKSIRTKKPYSECDWRRVKGDKTK
jgi:inhibitor of KinA sporulation pathway (predicted exonuclease)